MAPLERGQPHFDTILLRLLNEILSQRRGRVDEIVREFGERLERDGLGEFELPEPTQSLLKSPPNLLKTIEVLLDAYPHLAAVESERDKSLALHFAASYGSLSVAKLVYNHVSF